MSRSNRSITIGFNLTRLLIRPAEAVREEIGQRHFLLTDEARLAAACLRGTGRRAAQMPAAVVIWIADSGARRRGSAKILRVKTSCISTPLRMPIRSRTRARRPASSRASLRA